MVSRWRTLASALRYRYELCCQVASDITSGLACGKYCWHTLTCCPGEFVYFVVFYRGMELWCDR